MTKMNPHAAGNEPQLNQDLLNAAVRLNTWLLAAVFGAFTGLGLFLVTFMSMYRGLPSPGHYLNLLGVFLPGYSVSAGGAWIGLFWGTVLGGLLAAMFYRIYARSIAGQVQSFLRQGNDRQDLLDVTLRFDGNYLGLALGSIMALGLFITTAWLVARGTAAESFHAGLLAQYLPGYSVSLGGAVIGAVEVFAVTYLLSLMLSRIYNSVAVARGRNPL